MLLPFGVGALSSISDDHLRTLAGQVINGLLNSPALWLSVAFACGALVRSWWSGALLGTLGLVALTVGYYWYALSFGDRSSFGFAAMWPTVSTWLLIAVAAGAAAGLAGGLTRAKPRAVVLLGMAAVWLAVGVRTVVIRLPYWDNAAALNLWILGLHVAAAAILGVLALRPRR